MQEPLKTFLRGHLAVLLGLILLQNDALAQHISGRLFGNSRRTKLDGLIRDSSEFCKLYTCIAEGFVGGEGEKLDSEQLMGEDTLLRSSSNEKKHSMIATKVVDSLISLRDKS
jgi:hypothetical protein